MTPDDSDAPARPRLTYLRIRNYRALRDVELRDLTPLTVLIGPNGSGKSTVLDALDFLAEAVRGNLVAAWEKRNRFEGMQTKGSEGDIAFEVGFVSEKGSLNYRLTLAETNEAVGVADEVLTDALTNQRVFYKSSSKPQPRYPYTEYFSDIVKNQKALQFSNRPFLSSAMIREDEGELVNSLVDLLTEYRRVHLTDDHLKGYSDKGPREKLSANGDNLPNVLYYLHTRHPETLARITAQLRRWVPNLADVVPEITSDKRLLLRFRDAPFSDVLPAEYMSGGTMRLAALLTLLNEPNASGLLGIEEPENELHPRLLHELGEKLIGASAGRQLLVTTHAPTLLNPLEPEQVWILHRGPDGYTQATRVADVPGIREMVEEGSPLGYLWRSNFFDVDNPLAAGRN